MANPFLVLGGIAISVAAAAFGILQVPGWVASAQDASAINDLTMVREAQAVTVSANGKFAPTVGMLQADQGLKLTTAGPVNVDAFDDGWCATVQSKSGAFFAAGDITTRLGTGTSAQAAAADVGCVVGPECASSRWKATYFLVQHFAGNPSHRACMPELTFDRQSGTAPTPGLSSDYYSARFVTTIQEARGTVNVTVTHDDGARVLVDGREVYARPTTSASSNFTFPSTGQPQEILVEYVQGFGRAYLTFAYTVTPAAP